MIDYETFMRIKTCHEKIGLTCPQIARELGMDERTVRKWINQKRILSAKNHSAVAVNSIRSKRKSSGCWKLMPTPATQIFQRIREEKL